MKEIDSLYFETVVTRDAYRNGFENREVIENFNKFFFYSTAHGMTVKIERDEHAYATDGTIVRVTPVNKSSDKVYAPFCCTLEELPSVFLELMKSAIS